jgi:hypothetical protein
MNWIAILPPTDTSSLSSYVATSYIVWLSAFCTLAIYSYVFKDNPVYRAVIQAFIGINIGYGVVVNWQEVLKPQWWLPMVDSVMSVVHGTPENKWGLLWILVGILGLLWYFQLSRKYIWLSRIVIGLTVGIGAGLTFKSQFGQNIPQLTDSFRSLTPSVVGPTPLQRFSLPASDVQPAIADPVIFVASQQEAKCVEILNGKTVWSTQLSAKPNGALRLSGDNLLVPTNAGILSLDRNTGKSKAVAPSEKNVIAHLDFDGKDVIVTSSDLGQWKPGGTIESACVIKGLTAPERGDFDEIVAVVDGIPQAFDKEGKVIWKGTSDTSSHAVYDGGRYLFAESGKLLRVIDPLTGKVDKNITINGAQSFGQPCIARMPEPADDYIVGLVPTSNTKINGVMAINDKKTSRSAGELLWNYDTKKPITWMTSFDGVVIVSGPQGGACYDIPRPTAKQKVKEYADNWVFVVALLSVMVYFFFSFKQRTAKGVSQFSTIGRWVLMVGFGAIFGNTIMTRMSYLLERLMFLTQDWLFPLMGFLKHLIGL